MKIIILICFTPLLLGYSFANAQIIGNPHAVPTSKASTTTALVDNTTPKGYIDSKTQKWGLKTDDGRIIIKPKYDFAFSMYENLAPVKLNNKMGYIDSTEKVVIPFIYTDAWPFEKGLARVILGSKMGFIDKDGKQVIPVVYDWVDYFFSDTKVRVRNNEKYFFIDRNGKEVL